MNEAQYQAWLQRQISAGNLQSYFDQDSGQNHYFSTAGGETNRVRGEDGQSPEDSLRAFYSQYASPTDSQGRPVYGASELDYNPTSPYASLLSRGDVSIGGNQFRQIGYAPDTGTYSPFPEQAAELQKRGIDPASVNSLAQYDPQYGWVLPSDAWQGLYEGTKQHNPDGGWFGEGSPFQAFSRTIGLAMGVSGALSAAGVAADGVATAGAGQFGVDAPYWRTLADGGTLASDAAPAAAGTLGAGAETVLPEVTSVATPLSGNSALPYLLGGGAVGAGALAAGGGSAPYAGDAAYEASGTSDLSSRNASTALNSTDDSIIQRLLSGGGTTSDYVTAARLLGGPVASLLAGAYGANAAGDAADAQVAGTQAAIGEQRRQFDATRSDNAPFLATGTAANGRLRALLGLDPNYTGADSGSLTRKFSDADLQADPVYQSGLSFGLDEGRKGINARAIATGSYDSGGTLKALTKYATDYSSTKAGDAYNRYMTGNTDTYNKLAGVSGTGQVAANQVANAGATATNAISGNLTDAGNARAASIVGGANAWTGAAQGVNSALNQYSSNEILQALLKRNGGVYA